MPDKPKNPETSRRSAGILPAGSGGVLSPVVHFQTASESNAAEKATKYRKAAEQGDAYAQCSLGECYYYGDGVPKDFSEAGKWYRKSAEQGYVGAQYRLGDFYFFGNGVAQDLGESLEWYRKAARQGYETDLARRTEI